MHVLSLEKYREYFKDEKSLEEFVKIIDKILEEGESLLILKNERIIGMALPPEEVENMIKERIIRRLTKDS